jgi:hypothetical protein
MEAIATSANSGYIITLMAAETCSNAILALCGKYGKSPCFSEASFLSMVGPDYPLLILPCVNG